MDTNNVVDALQSEINRLIVQEKQITFTLKKLRGTIKVLTSNPKYAVVNMNGNHRKKFSHAVRERMAAAQRLRWQKVFAKRRKAA